MMEPSFNAATVGKDDKLNITAAYSMQMTGFRHAPKTMYAAADMPLIIFRKRHGIGLLFQNDEIGLFSHKRFTAQYAFHWEKLFGGRLSFGLQADLLPHIRMCLDKMKEKGFFKDTNLSDLEISGMNFGWEVPGTFRAAASIKDLSLRTTAR